MSRSRFALTALAAMLLAAAPSLQAVDLQSIPGTDTKLQVYGFVMAYGNYFANGYEGPSNTASSMFYAGQAPAIMNQSGNATQNFAFNISPTRFGFASTTPSANLGDISTKIEYDLNGSNSHLRMAYIKIGGWTVGQAWSTWTDLDAGADTVDWAGAIGSACYDTPRIQQVSYTAAFDKNNTLQIGLEQNLGNGDGVTEVSGATKTTYVVTYPNAGAGGPGVPVVTTTTGVAVPAAGKLDGKLPSLVAAYTYSDSWGHIALRALAQNYDVYIPATAYSSGTSSSVTTNPPQAATPTAQANSSRFNKMQGAFQVSGDFKIAKDDLIFSVYNGTALGQYGNGIQSALINEATQTITGYKSTGWVVGYTHNWSDTLRSNLVASGVTYSGDSAIATTQGAGATDIKTMSAYFVNTIVKLSKSTELGFEYVYEGAKGFGTNQGLDNNANPTSTVNASKVEVALTAHF